MGQLLKLLLPLLVLSLSAYASDFALTPVGKKQLRRIERDRGKEFTVHRVNSLTVYGPKNQFRSVINSPVGPIASSVSATGTKVDRISLKKETMVITELAVGKRLPRLLRGVAAAREIRPGDTVKYTQTTGTAGVKVSVKRGAAELKSFSIDKPALPLAR